MSFPVMMAPQRVPVTSILDRIKQGSVVLAAKGIFKKLKLVKNILL